MAEEALIVIDLQNDFCPGGALAVAGGDEIVPLVNDLIRHSEHVVLTQDWHPAAIRALPPAIRASSLLTRSTCPMAQQTLWPDHCIQGSVRLGFHPALNWAKAELVIRKGFRQGIDSYSAFFENDHTTPTGLAGYLRERGIDTITLVGLATDFCVAFSALDAVAQGFATTVRLDACRGIDLGGSLEAMTGRMREAGVRLA